MVKFSNRKPHASQVKKRRRTFLKITVVRAQTVLTVTAGLKINQYDEGLSIESIIHFANFKCINLEYITSHLRSHAGEKYLT